MHALREAALKNPVGFALLMLVVLTVLYIIAGVVAAVVSTNDATYQVTEALARLAAAGLVILAVWRLGLLREAGIAERGVGWIWVLALAVLIYRTLAHSYAFFGDLGLAFAGAPLSGPVALNGSAAAFLEELAFRGAMLSLLLMCWRTLPGGVMKAALLTAALFGASHVIRLAMGQAAPIVGLLVLDSFLAGIFYAAAVIRGRSLWPVVAIHVVLNAYVGARAMGVAGFEETTSAWVIILLLGLPLPVLGLYLLRGVDARKQND
jgi:membrane protease YdiL (CAAX protease family)